MMGLFESLKLMKKNKLISYSSKPTRTLDIICQLRHPGNGLIFLVSFLTYLLGVFPSLVFVVTVPLSFRTQVVASEVCGNADFLRGLLLSFLRARFARSKCTS